MIVAGINIIPGTGQIIGQDIWATIEEELKAHSSELGRALKDEVYVKTPVLSGSLQSDLTFAAADSPGGYTLGPNDLVYVYAEGVEQQAYWNRIYVQYVEGGPLGMPTWTNPPRMVFLSTAENEGLDTTTVWAEIYVQEAIDRCVYGLGVPGTFKSGSGIGIGVGLGGGIRI